MINVGSHQKIRTTECPLRVNSNYGCFMNSLIVVHELTSLTIHHMADYSLLIGNPVATFLLICGNNLVSSWQYIPKRPLVFHRKKKTSCTCLGLSSSCSICLRGLSRLTPPQGTVSKLQLSTQGKLQLCLKSSKNTIIVTLNNKKS